MCRGPWRPHCAGALSALSYFARHAYIRLSVPLSLDCRTTSNAPPQLALACCEQESEPAGH